MILLRDTFCEKGIFGTLRSDDDQRLFYTLERAYLRPDGEYKPKIPSGAYQCERGVHRLSHGSAFETFEVQGVYGHWGLLFHAGNRNEDSNGCILIGETRISNVMIGRSRVAFLAFMDLLKNARVFSLNVVGG